MRLKISHWVITFPTGAIYGPFNNTYVARQYATKQLGVGWSIAPVYEPLGRKVEL